MEVPPLRIISAAEVRRCLPMADAIAAMESVFIRLSAGEAVLPPRTHLELPASHGSVLIMPSALPAAGCFGLKSVALFAGNPARGLPRIQSIMLLQDGETGCGLAMMDGASLTAIRTGAASGVATRWLARPDACRVAIFGAGVQGRTQLEAVAAVRPVRLARIYDPAPGQAAMLADELSGRLGFPVEAAATPAEALHRADIVCTATVSKTPVFEDESLAPGVHINAVGSYQPTVREIPAATVCRARIVVDHTASASEEAGDLLIPVREGLLPEQALNVEIGQIAAGRMPGRQSPGEVTLFKSVGVAVQDLAAAWLVWQRAGDLGLGTTVRL